MREPQIERTPRAATLVSRSRLIYVVGAAALLLLAVSFGRLMVARYQLNQRAEGIRQDIAALRTENGQLQSELDYWKSDAGVERLAREQLGLVKPGETVAVIAGAPTPAARATAASNPAPVQPAAAREAPPNWQRWWRAFFGP